MSNLETPAAASGSRSTTAKSPNSLQQAKAERVRRAKHRPRKRPSPPVSGGVYAPGGMP